MNSRVDRRPGPLVAPAGGNFGRRGWPRPRRRDRRLLLYELSFTAGAHAPASAQAAVGEVIEDRLDEAAADDVRMLVTELVSSRLAQRPEAPAETVSLTVMLLPRLLHVEVADPAREVDVASLLVTPAPRSPRGPRLFAALASRWGVRSAPAGVWFELDRPRSGFRAHG